MTVQYPATSIKTVPPSEAFTKDIYDFEPDHFSPPVVMPEPLSLPVSACRVVQTQPTTTTLVSWLMVARAQPVPVLVPRGARAQHVCASSSGGGN